MSTPKLTIDGPIATLTMDDGRGNAINPDFLDAMENALRDAQSARVLILQGRPTLFSGGLDLPFLNRLQRSELEPFIEHFDRVHAQLLSFPRPIITCARGGAIAGGAVLLCVGDERLVTPNARVGINEVAIGFNFPTSALELVRVAVGDHRLVEAATLGRIYQGDDCRRIGFATEIVSPDRIELRARELAEEYSRLDPSAVQLVRQQIRRTAVERVARYGTEDRLHFVDQWFSAATQARLTEVVARLAGR